MKQQPTACSPPKKNESASRLIPIRARDCLGRIPAALPHPARTAAARFAAVASLAGVFFITTQVSRAAVLAYEGFNYGAGANLTGQNGGFGWNGAWQGVVNGSSTVQSGSLAAGANAPSGYDSHSAGNAAFTPNGTRTGRFLDTSAGGIFGQKGYLNGSGNIGAAGKTLYISFLQQPDIANNNYYEFEFHRGNLNDPGRIAGVGSDTGGSSSVYLRTPGINQNAIGPASTSVSFYVVRIDFLGGNDTVTVYQNPTSATEPGTATLVESGAGDMSLNGISFGAFVNGATVAHDEVRLGETWADVTSPAAASTGLWTGSGANSRWSTGGNWDNGVVPTFAESLTFAGSTRLNNTNDISGISANNLTFDSAAGAFVLNGNSLGLNGNIAFTGNPASPVTQTINLPLTPTVNITVDTPANGNLNLAGNVTSGSLLTKIDSGTLTLGGTNTFSALSASGGTNIITGNTTFTGGGTFYLADGDFINGCQDTMIIQPGATLTVQGTYNDAAVLGRDSGSAKIVQNGGVFNFNIGNNHFLFVGASGSTATQAEYDMNNGLLDMNGNTLGIALGANAVITCAVNQVGGVVTNVGNLFMDPFFTQGFGIYNLTGGSLWIEAGGITAQPGGSYQLNFGGGTVGAEASWSSGVSITLTGSNGPTTFKPAGNTILLSGILSGVGGLTASGPGTLELSGANTYTGDTTIPAGGTVQLDSTGSSAGAFRIATGGTLVLNYSGTFAVGSLYTNGVALAVGSYNSSTLPGFITGGGSLQVASGISHGIWQGLGGNNNWSTPGNWDNNAVPIFPRALTFPGSTRLTNNNDLTGITISSVTFSNAGAYVIGGNNVTLSGPISFTANPVAPVTETINLGMNWTVDETIDTPTNGNFSLGGGINASTNDIFKVDAGTLTLGGADTFQGYVINGGTNVITGNVSVVGNGGTAIYLGNASTNFSGTMVIQPGGTFSVSGSFNDAMVIGRDGGSGRIIQNGGLFSYNVPSQFTLYVGATSHLGTQAEYDLIGGTVDMNGGTLGVALGDAGASYSAFFNQTGGLVSNVFKLDLGAVRASGRGIYNLTGGQIVIDLGGIVSDSGFYNLNLGGGTVSASSGWASSLNMTLTGSNGPVTFDTGAGNTITLSGQLSGPGGLKVAGSGVLELSGTGSYAGDTTVTSGVLQLDVTGSSPGAFRVGTGGLFNLGYTGNYVVSALYTNGVALPTGTYNSANLPGFIAGSGNLQVVGNVSSGLWTGSGGNNNWSTPGNWDHNAVPLFPYPVTFAGSTRLANNNDLAGLTITTMTFSNNAGAFTIGGNPITLSGSIGFTGNPASPVTQTVNLGMTWTSSQTIDTPANGNLTLGGNITSSSDTSLVKVDTGTLTLGGTDALQSFDLNVGNTVITGNVTVNGAGGSRIYVADGDSSAGCNGTLTIQPGGVLAITGNYGDAMVLGRDGGSATLVQNGGTFTFNPANQNFLFVGASGSTATHSVYDLNGGVLDMSGKTLGIALGANAVISCSVNQAGGIITNLGSLFFDPFFTQGFGTYNLTGGTNYIGSGGITVQPGGGYALNLGGGTIGAQATWSSSLAMTLTGINGPVSFNPGGNTITLSGALSGSGGLTVSGGGVLELAGASSYTGNTQVSAGTLKLDTTNNASGTFTLSGGATLNLNYSGTLVVGSLFTNNVSLAVGTYNSGNLPAYITGTGSIQVSGSIPTSPTSLSFNVTGTSLTLSWPANYVGWILQEQTNSLQVGVGTNWFDVPGSAAVTSTNISINKAIPTVFYRLRYPFP